MSLWQLNSTQTLNDFEKLKRYVSSFLSTSYLSVAKSNKRNETDQQITHKWLENYTNCDLLLSRIQANRNLKFILLMRWYVSAYILISLSPWIWIMRSNAMQKMLLEYNTTFFPLAFLRPFITKVTMVTTQRWYLFYEFCLNNHNNNDNNSNHNHNNNNHMISLFPFFQFSFQ